MKTVERESRTGIVCIVDDDEAVRDSLAFLLGAYGFGVKTHRSGAELLADRRVEDYACIVLDVHMPAMDGLKVLKAMRLRSVAVPIIMISGLVDPSLREQTKAAGAVALLLKPLDSEELIKAITHAAGDFHAASPAA